MSRDSETKARKKARVRGKLRIGSNWVEETVVSDFSQNCLLQGFTGAGMAVEGRRIRWKALGKALSAEIEPRSAKEPRVLSPRH